MTLLSALRATKVLGLAVVLVAGGMTAADARDGWHGRHHDHHKRMRKLPTLEREKLGGHLGTSLHDGRSERGMRQGDRSFYSGAITAYRDHGNGIYFHVDDDGVVGWNGRPARHLESGPKVIVVAPGLNGCSWEAGVCVIRPGQ